MMDANQVWGVDEAIAAMRTLAAHDPWWIEEPTSPDDILGHARIRARDRARPCRHRRAHPEPGRVQAALPGRGDRRLPAGRVPRRWRQRGDLDPAPRCQVRVPVCPHAGGVGLCEYVQHLALFDYVAVSGSLENRVVEWVDHLHEHFRDPAVVRDGRYVAPTAPGYSIEMLPESLGEYAFPEGPAWVDVAVAVGED